MKGERYGPEPVGLGGLEGSAVMLHVLSRAGDRGLGVST